MIFDTSLKNYVEQSLNNDELKEIVQGIADASVEIWQSLAASGRDVWVDTKSTNYFGEAIKNIDISAKAAILNKIAANPNIQLLTEEDTDQSYSKKYGYTLLVDPIDGSKHVQYQSSCGTFFTIVATDTGEPIISGYALYSYSLTIVLAIDKKLAIATYDAGQDILRLVNGRYAMPTNGKVYSLNDADIDNFPSNTATFVVKLRNLGYKSRYNGVLVADVHRILFEGGIFVSPRLANGKTKTKKYFEAIAISHIISAANGSLEQSYRPKSNFLTNNAELFSTVSLIFGSKTEVADYKRSYQ